MHESGKSDGSITPGKPPNKDCGAPRSAEGVEDRGPAKGNSGEQTNHRAQNRARLKRALDRIRQVAQRGKEVRFTTLWHHVYDVDRLREAYFGLTRKAAAGMDGRTWAAYGQSLEGHLADLSARLKRGAYRAKPVREADFAGFSYGFRRGRGQHDALDAIAVAIKREKVGWVLDADIRGFFDAISREWLMKFVEHRIAEDVVPVAPPAKPTLHGHVAAHASFGRALATGATHLPSLSGATLARLTRGRSPVR